MLTVRNTYRQYIVILAIVLVSAISRGKPGAEIENQELVALNQIQQSPVQIGEIETAELTISYQDRSTWRQKIHYPGASFLKLHLAKIDLMVGDRLVISNADGSHSHSYPGSGYTTGEEEGIWALSVVGDTAIIELLRDQNLVVSPDAMQYEKAMAGVHPSDLGVHIDMYTRGYPEFLMALEGPDSTCGTNERTDVACYETSHPTEYDRSHAVARITLNGSALCTAWRVSPGNFVMTNEHCITSQAGLDGVEFWFNYQRETCESGPASTPTIVAGDTFLIDDFELDFALVTLDNFQDIEHFGFLELDPRTPILGEEIYIAQHGAGNPKEFGIESDFNPPNLLCQIDDAIRNGRGLNTDTGYFCDTTGGSSGSPVLARSSDKVIGLHHYGTGGAACGGSVMNGGVRMDLIYPLIESYFPDDFTITTTPESQEICAPDLALYDVELGKLFSFDEPVDLEVAGLPAGSTATFSDDPVVPPATSVLSMTTSGVSPGVHYFEVVGVATTIIHSSTAAMTVRMLDPVSPVLLSPADGASDVEVKPILSWMTVDQTTTYEVEMATDAAFSNIVFSGTSEIPSIELEVNLVQLTTYYWHVRAINACSVGGFSPTFSFTTKDVPALLLVDDDNDEPDVQDYYRMALDYLVGSDSYDIHDNQGAGNTPTIDELANYDQVIWFTGNDGGGSAGPDNASELTLASWLDDDGCLLVSSQDYLSDRGLTPLITNYLGVGSATQNVGHETVTGQGSVFGALGSFNLDYPFTNRSDKINPNSFAEVAFGGNNGNAGIDKDGGAYRTAFLAFPWEAIPTINDRQMTLASFLSWCDPATSPAIDVSPLVISTTMPLGVTSTLQMNVGNTGDDLLIWSVTEDMNSECESVEDIQWLELSRESGTTVPGSSIPFDVIFDSTRAGAGQHTARLCIASNDDLSPVVSVALNLTVEQAKYFLPRIEN
jgi:V8-like Glu-specific endopeptidase